MANEPFLNQDVAINFPLESVDETALKVDEPPPPAYEYPQLEFSSGWKDRGFAITFWIHIVAVIIVGSVLGIPVLFSYVKHNISNRQEQTSFDPNIRLFVYSLGGAAITGGFMSFIIFSLLRQFAGRIIKCSLAIIIIIEIFVCAFLLHMKFWAACIGPGIILLMTICYVRVIQERIPFAEAHLKVSCAVLRNHPSMIFVALIMLVVEFLWLIFWCLMVLGIVYVTELPILNRNINLTVINVSSTTAFTVSTKPTLINRTPYMIDSATYRSNNELYRYNTIPNSSANSQNSYSHVIVARIVLFFLLVSWYWGATTFANIVHFITACTVGRWWFTANTGQQYVLRTSFKRAFTTNFGTICFGSLLEAIIKALRACASKKRNSLLGRCITYILEIIEEVIGYINEWAFIYAALTGQSFIEAGRSFIGLFRNRGWTMIINDSIVENCLRIVNVVVGLLSAAVGGLIVYILIWNTSKETINTIIVLVIISFLVGVFLSAIMTTILTSCVRTIFVCFALNPAALGATHPDHLQTLANVWHKSYPTEFAASGYNNYVPKPATETFV